MIERQANVTELQHKRYLQVADIFAEAFDNGGAVAAGAAVREALGGAASLDISTLEALQPYVRDAMERRGFEFDDEDDS